MNKKYADKNRFSSKEKNVATGRFIKADQSKEELSPGTVLNKFLSNAGVASRRNCATLIQQGLVMVNGKAILTPAYRVQNNDEVVFRGKKISGGKKVYILLNKPKDFITTTHDEHERHTVMELIKNATTERVFPVGRLDRNTTGLLLFTNDGELAQKLTHPSKKVKKVYEVMVNKEVAEQDLEKIAKGIELEDGIAAVDDIAFSNPADRSIIGIELHIGKNRIVRRIFEHLGYDVRRLDRVLYAGLTKKDLPRGRWRHLSEKEVRQLKVLS
ncbi:MAG: rRNA pseudouridine synthase [Chitinophagales bacterium]|nr:rRNA pseudouridine synthase [Chitinophagales bacterium]